MRKNLVQTGKSLRAGERRFIEYDWYANGIPANILLGENVYIDSSYGFAAFHSEQETGLKIGEATGTYDRASFVVGRNGKVSVGSFTVLNGTTIICNDEIKIGSHCLLAWGSVITDTYTNFANAPLEKRFEVLKAAAENPARILPPILTPKPVVLEDNVWIGFDSVILPGVNIGRGAVIGSKTIVAENVPPYAIVVGNPTRIVRYLEADDTEEAWQNAMKQYLAV